jgi:hypothetical protein
MDMTIASRCAFGNAAKPPEPYASHRNTEAI